MKKQTLRILPNNKVTGFIYFKLNPTETLMLNCCLWACLIAFYFPELVYGRTCIWIMILGHDLSVIIVSIVVSAIAFVEIRTSNHVL